MCFLFFFLLLLQLSAREADIGYTGRTPVAHAVVFDSYAIPLNTGAQRVKC